jgi:hypothetical protein
MSSWRVLLFFAAVVWLIISARLVTVKKIDERYVWLKGINLEHLNQFDSVQAPY